LKDAPRVTSGGQLEALADVELRDNVDVALIEDQRVTPHSRLPDLDEAEMHVPKARGSTARKHHRASRSKVNFNIRRRGSPKSRGTTSGQQRSERRTGEH
jgi:hypothetical protein